MLKQCWNSSTVKSVNSYISHKNNDILGRLISYILCISLLNLLNLLNLNTELIDGISGTQIIQLPCQLFSFIHTENPIWKFTSIQSGGSHLLTYPLMSCVVPVLSFTIWTLIVDIYKGKIKHNQSLGLYCFFMYFCKCLHPKAWEL